MTEEQRDQLITTLRNLGKSMEQTGDERDTATAACLYGVCLAISVEAEVELARHILMLDGDGDTDIADSAMEAGDARGH